MSISERRKELRRRRHRRRKIAQWKRRLGKATVSEKAFLAAKIRNLAPGAEQIIKTLALEER